MSAVRDTASGVMCPLRASPLTHRRRPSSIVSFGPAMVLKHREHLAHLIESGADPAVVAAIRNKLDMCKESTRKTWLNCGS
jgi:hypothetical protein